MEIPRWFKFILLLSILRQEFVSADNICRTFSFHIRQNLVADHALEGHVFKVATVTTIPECHILCINDCRCVSMNYEHKTAQGNCQMNDANRYMKPAALRYKYGALYYDLVREYSVSDKGRPLSSKTGQCVNRCCKDNPCLQGGTCQEICDPATVRYNCTCPANYTGQRCEKIKHPRNCMEVAKNGHNVSGMFDVYDSQKNIFRVYCDLNSEVGYVWTLIQSYSLANNHQFKSSGFSVDRPVNEEGSTINWNAYRLSLAHMKSIADVSTHLRATCNFPADGLVHTDYARAKLEGHDLFGVWIAKCRTYELINIRNITCQGCTVGTWQAPNEIWHINSAVSAKSAGCQFNGEAGASPYEQNFGLYNNVNPKFRCTSSQSSTTQHWIGNIHIYP